MKIYLFAIISLLMISCKSKTTVDPNLPKDIALKPQQDLSSEKVSYEGLLKLKKEIEAFGETKCMNSASWKFSAVGAKPCGGPEFYAAYPILREQEFLAKVNAYNTKSSQYNLETGAMSDCSIVEAPTRILCKDGKLSMEYGNTTELMVNEILQTE